MEASGEAAQQLEADGAVADTVGKDWRALEKVRLRADNHGKGLDIVNTRNAQRADDADHRSGGGPNHGKTITA